MLRRTSKTQALEIARLEEHAHCARAVARIYERATEGLDFLISPEDREAEGEMWRARLLSRKQINARRAALAAKARELIEEAETFPEIVTLMRSVPDPHAEDGAQGGSLASIVEPGCIKCGAPRRPSPKGGRPSSFCGECLDSLPRRERDRLMRMKRAETLDGREG